MESFVPSFWRSASEGVRPVLKGRVEPSRSLVRFSPITLGSFLLVNSSGKTSGQYWSAWDTGTRRSCILRSCTLCRAATSGSNEQKNRERKIWECQMLGGETGFKGWRLEKSQSSSDSLCVLCVFSRTSGLASMHSSMQSTYSELPIIKCYVKRKLASKIFLFHFFSFMFLFFSRTKSKSWHMDAISWTNIRDRKEVTETRTRTTSPLETVFEI